MHLSPGCVHACTCARLRNDRVPLEEGRLSKLSGARSLLKRAAQIELEKVGRAIMKSQVVPASEGHGGGGGEPLRVLDTGRMKLHRYH